MKAVIAGGAGALGSSVAKILIDLDLYDIHIYDIIHKDRAWRLGPIIDDVIYHWKSVHDMDPTDFENTNLVVYASAQPDRPLGISSPAHTIYENCMGLTRVLEACKYANIDKFLYPGSGTTFTGVPHDQLPVTESTIPMPTNPYSASKYMDEILCDTYRRCYKVPTVILRSGLVYGPGMRLGISVAQFIIKALEGGVLNVTSPEATRTPTYLEDVLKYWKAVITLPPEMVVGNIFHSVYGKEYSILAIAEEVINVVGNGEVKISSRYEKGESLRGKPVREWTTSTKDEYLGVKLEFDLAEGIQKTVQYIREALDI